MMGNEGDVTQYRVYTSKHRRTHTVQNRGQEKHWETAQREGLKTFKRETQLPH